MKNNETLQAQVRQLSQDKEALEKEIATLKREVTKNSMLQSKLDHLRKIVRMMNSRTFVSRAKYVKNLVRRFGLNSAKHRRTPIGTHEKITKDEAGNGVDQTLYRSMIWEPVVPNSQPFELVF